MTAGWMVGSAVAAMLAAAPAFAQHAPGRFGPCTLDGMTNERFTGLDANDDTTLSLDEYKGCAAEAKLTLDPQQAAAYEEAYTEADADGNSQLAFGEIESLGETDTAAADAPQGTVTVTQPAANVTVSEPAPALLVKQQAPEVTIENRAPEVTVSAPEPQVAVTQPEPRVSVKQAEPQVTVTQAEPTVDVTQGEPQVDVSPGQPAVIVATPDPQVAVTTPEPQVDVRQPDADVNVAQAEPNVAADQPAPDARGEQAPTVANGAAPFKMSEASDEVSPAHPETAVPDAMAVQIRIGDLKGADVVNVAGDEIGSIDDVLLDPTANAPVIVVSVGGILGIGDKEIVFPYSDLTITGGDVVLNTDMTGDQIKDLPAYDETAYEALPESMIVR